MVTSDARDVRPVNYRGLMKKVEQAVAAMDRAEDVGSTIHSLLEIIIDKFHDELGIYGGRLYQRRGGYYVLQATFGDAKEVPQGLKVPISYPPIQLLLEEGTVYMEAEDPNIDRNLEDLLGVQQFAAIEVGSEEYILAFNVAPGHDRDDILFSLGILRHSVNQKIRRDKMEGIFEEARKIQASILPRREPDYGEFDIFGRSEPMEEVGGDFFDYIPLTKKILGLAIADVSGHGLPAALQVRDIYMGLRMGLARDFKIIRTVERMNHIIHQSTLTSRFVSMFYGELELNGVFIYVNAGHPPPIHLAADGTVRNLEEGGPVLGPLPDATYERGFVTDEAGRHAGLLHRRHLRDPGAGRARPAARRVRHRAPARGGPRAPGRDRPRGGGRHLRQRRGVQPQRPRGRRPHRHGGEPPGDRHLGHPGVPAADGAAVGGRNKKRKKGAACCAPTTTGFRP